jgi:hypothetical protein
MAPGGSEVFSEAGGSPAAAVEQRWRRIEKAAKGSQQHAPDWKADAWALERTYAQFFCRPEIQLSVNQSVSTGPTNIVVLGPERAAVLVSRQEKIRAETLELLNKARPTEGEPQSGNGQSEVVACQAEPVPAPALEPEEFGSV